MNGNDLLIGEQSNTVSQYLALNFDGGSTTIDVSANGNGTVTQKIVLENVDLSAEYGTTDNQAILDSLLANGNLVIDQ
nr:type I secretion C-terminal target domain-containing protein [Spartinivicinus marinus]